MSIEAGKFIGQTTSSGHRLVDTLGIGTRSVVLVGRNNRTQLETAVKVMDEAYPPAAFVNEVETHQSLGHPNIPRLHTSGDTAFTYVLPASVAGETFSPVSRHHYFMVMDRATGGSVKDYIDANGPLDDEAAIKTLTHVGDALIYAHDLGIVHRDVSTENILFTRIPGVDERIAQLADWGAAGNPYQPGNTQPFSIVKLGHMAPEQREGKADKRSDVYGLGIAAYHIMAGKLPNAIGPQATFLDVLGQQMTPINDALWPIVEKMIAQDPQNRHGSVGDALDEIHTAYTQTTGRQARQQTTIDLYRIKANLDAHASGVQQDHDRREQELDEIARDLATQAARNSATATALEVREQALDLRSQVVTTAEQGIVEKERLASERTSAAETASKRRIRTARAKALAFLTRRRQQLDEREQNVRDQEQAVLAKDKAATDRLTAVTKAEAVLAQKVQTAEAQVTQAAQDLDALKQEYQRGKGLVAGLTQRQTTLEGNVTQLEQDKAQLENEVAALERRKKKMAAAGRSRFRKKVVAGAQVLALIAGGAVVIGGVGYGAKEGIQRIPWGDIFEGDENPKTNAAPSQAPNTSAPSNPAETAQPRVSSTEVRPSVAAPPEQDKDRQEMMTLAKKLIISYKEKDDIRNAGYYAALIGDTKTAKEAIAYYKSRNPEYTSYTNMGLIGALIGDTTTAREAIEAEKITPPSVEQGRIAALIGDTTMVKKVLEKHNDPYSAALIAAITGDVATVKKGLAYEESRYTFSQYMLAAMIGDIETTKKGLAAFKGQDGKDGALAAHLIWALDRAAQKRQSVPAPSSSVATRLFVPN